MEFDTNRVLLTGAGFTHNFGAPLARDFWYLVFNHPRIQNDSIIRDLLVNDLDYESVYSSVVDGEYTESQKSAINDAIREAYERLDHIVRNWRFRPDSSHPVNIYKVQELINLFWITNQRESKKGFLFTTNQDLFMERHYYNGERPVLPGIQTHGNLFSSVFNWPLRDSDYYGLPTAEDLSAKKNQMISKSSFFYIKLHGSHNWRSRIKAGKMVIGRTKRSLIHSEPLLEWYFEIFNAALRQKGCNLLIIGYGFGDEHINEVMARGVTESGLNIFIISPEPFDRFQSNVASHNGGKDILNGLRGYFPFTLLQMFPPDQSTSQAWIEVKERFFGLKQVN